MRYGTEKVDGLDIFYREAGDPSRQNYGAPIGFRIATKHPEKVKGIVIMNGNAYEKGLNKKARGRSLNIGITKMRSWKNK